VVSLQLGLLRILNILLWFKWKLRNVVEIENFPKCVIELPITKLRNSKCDKFVTKLWLLSLVCVFVVQEALWNIYIYIVIIHASCSSESLWYSNSMDNINRTEYLLNGQAFHNSALMTSVYIIVYMVTIIISWVAVVVVETAGGV